MDNVLEQQRKLHEERERLEDAVAKESLLKKATVSRYNKTNNELGNVLTIQHVMSMPLCI